MGKSRKEAVKVYADSCEKEIRVASSNERVSLQSFHEEAKGHLPEIKRKQGNLKKDE